MLETFKFVQGAVSTKNFIPEMKHFVVRDGRVTGFNGVLALSSPVDFDLACAPKAVPLVKAIGSCTEVVSIGLTPANRLRVQSGKFRAYIECAELEGMPQHEPQGEVIEFDGEAMLAAIAALSPFVGNDASRPWTNGILLRGQSAFATNNVCLVEYWLGVQLPFTVNIPMAAIREMTRIGQPPVHAQVSPHSITFHYEDGRWLRTQLYSTDWPDLGKILDQANNAAPVPEGLFEALDMVKPFLDADGAVHFAGGCVRTSTEEELGGVCEVPGLPDTGIYRHAMLKLLDGVAQQIDFAAYPAPLIFYGDRLRGAITGMKA